jgi:Sap, sulfolipid-1-addressing protein
VARTVRSVQDGSVSVDALVLALASVIRPLSVAAVYAMLSTARPTRLLTAYIGAGFVFSTGLGIVWSSCWANWPGRVPRTRCIAAIPFILGAVSLSYAAGLLSGWVQAPAPDRTGATPGPDASSWLGRQLADLSGPRAALGGVLTHKPGLFYLAALSAITNSTSSNVNRIFQVALYNAIWFAMPVAALALARHRPVELQDFLRRTTAWVWRRHREIMITAFGLLGVYLIVRGVVELRS